MPIYVLILKRYIFRVTIAGLEAKERANIGACSVAILAQVVVARSTMDSDDDGLVFEPEVAPPPAGNRWTPEMRHATGITLAAARLRKRCAKHVEDCFGVF